jgi:hypothetical protein
MKSPGPFRDDVARYSYLMSPGVRRAQLGHCLDNQGKASCIIDGEAVACGEDGLSSFDRAKSGHCRASCRASRLPFLRAITRKPSCLTSCSHSFGWRGRGIGGGGMAE